MAETPIVSETLQQEFRSTFPSQISSGRDLHVSDTIIPVVDFTAEAGASTLPDNLAQAFSYDSITSFSVNNTTSTVINTAGYWRLAVNFSANENALGDSNRNAGLIVLNDGSTDKTLLNLQTYGTNGISANANQFYDIIIYVKSGESVKITTTGTYAYAVGSTRQVATSTGTIVNPT